MLRHGEVNLHSIARTLRVEYANFGDLEAFGEDTGGISVLQAPIGCHRGAKRRIARLKLTLE